ncbi:MAG: Nucleoid-associated protein [Eubacteriales bacterium SKADARSKE-1]|nr:Nucleoid-associated protein [Eubacteriales bacterium SKADARSKE-1]
MKARLPKGYGSGGIGNIQQLASKAQKMQEDMKKVTMELEEKDYVASSGGNAVKVTATGKMEIKSIEISPEVVDKDDIEMLSDLVIAAVNEALRMASNEKSEAMEQLSGGLNMPGLF